MPTEKNQKVLSSTHIDVTRRSGNAPVYPTKTEEEQLAFLVRTIQEDGFTKKKREK
jgi:hypothetical protein